MSFQGIRVRFFISLLKPRVMSLAVYTALVGIILAPGHIGLLNCIVSILAIAIGAGASGVLNMYYDADIDRVMSRTAFRPIPTGKISPREALILGLFLAVCSVIIMGLAINWISAYLLLLSIFIYVVVYTIWLKRITPQNIVIGGIAGAIPPMIGWSSVSGGISVECLVMFLVIFLWTPPHFWSLALLYKDDYAAANIPMLPNVRTDKVTKIYILVYTVLTAIAGLLPTIIGFASTIYGIIALFLGNNFVLWALRVAFFYKEDENTIFIRKLFLVSIVYLFALFSILMVDHIIDGRAIERYFWSKVL
ncbi:MAG: protoheme IX farnesyltransferase [Candidatus Liberibacter europaeus]|uniref:Protoheme IX farnesyltransferase n=1 Tax=Candidatus Liberibacter europaeus TaxID=744859 RepID=A0A2T4VXP5_9HYPH|nr:protoheme IX farnesyltransferase [Candidatus Liberibacter europaeus]PTL86547.1 MAG: protoheme IX farnesyltransferase [Candidatus Liberibacter europaeus]